MADNNGREFTRIGDAPKMNTNLPKNGTVLSEVNGRIYRIPAEKLSLGESADSTFVVNLSEQGAFDKTFEEVNAAFHKGPVILNSSSPDGDYSESFLATGCLSDNRNGVFFVFAFVGEGRIEFVCNNVHDYPTIQQVPTVG